MLAASRGIAENAKGFSGTEHQMNFEKWQHYLRARFFQFMNREDAALDEYRRTLAVAPGFSRAAISIAFIHAGRSDFAQAAQAFREVLRTEPDNADMLFNLGFACDKQGELDEAIRSFEAAVKLKPQFDRAWYGLGICHARQGDHAAAAGALHEAATLQPMNPHAWYALGMAHHHLNDPERVTEIAKHLHRFDPVMTRHLIRDTGRTDLDYLVADLAV